MGRVPWDLADVHGELLEGPPLGEGAQGGVLLVARRDADEVGAAVGKDVVKRRRTRRRVESGRVGGGARGQLEGVGDDAQRDARAGAGVGGGEPGDGAGHGAGGEVGEVARIEQQREVRRGEGRADGTGHEHGGRREELQPIVACTDVDAVDATLVQVRHAHARGRHVVARKHRSRREGVESRTALLNRLRSGRFLVLEDA